MARSSKWIYELNFTSKEDRDVRDVLQAWEWARRQKAEREMAQAAALHGDCRHFSAPDGFGGEITIRVHAESFHYWGQKEGYACWKDDQFKREYWRDNPAARVRNHARQTTVAVPGNGPTTAKCKKRFSKSYSSEK